MRMALHVSGPRRDLGLFKLAMDSNLRACDLVTLRVRNAHPSGRVAARANVMQQEDEAAGAVLRSRSKQYGTDGVDRRRSLSGPDCRFPIGIRSSPHLSTRQYARIVKTRFAETGLDPRAYSTHSLRRTKASIIYRRTRNLRAVQLLLGHARVESSHLGIEVDDALEIAEQTDVLGER